MLGPIMQPYSLIPPLAVALINLAVLVWVVRDRSSIRSAFFLILNALSLILWAGGKALFRVVGEEQLILALPYLAALVVPCNMLYYSLTRPHPIRRNMHGPLTLAILFAPALVLTLLEDYSTISAELLFNYSYRVDVLSMDTLLRRATALYLTVLLIMAASLFGVRYYMSSGPEQNIFKHLIAIIFGPVLFGAIFWVSSPGPGPVTIPSPSFLFAAIAQMAIIVVIRQEELDKPRYLGRVVYALSAVLIAFTLIHFFSEFYSFVQGTIVLNRTFGWLLLVTTLTLVLVSRIGFVERGLARVLFTRAAEYRQLVDETRAELREARERMRKAERFSMVGEVAARVAHEIKNPLGPIRGYTQMMREKLEGEKDFRHRDRFLEYLSVIQEEVDNIDRRVRDLLQNARQPQLFVEETDINALVERCARVLRLELSAGRELDIDVLPIIIDVELDPAVPAINVDRLRIEEAIFNIARNSLDALAEQTRGRILLRTHRQADTTTAEDGIAIHVLDNGPGFPSDVIRVEPFLTSKATGTGLGLSIVKATVEAHGGTMDLANRPSGGCEVRLWLPRFAKPNPGALLPKAV